MFRAAILLSVVLPAGCASLPGDGHCPELSPVVAAPGLSEQSLARLAEAPRDSQRRQQLVHRYFEEAGCPRLIRQDMPGGRYKNIVCVLPGASTDRIVIGAHHDKLGGRGFADNWSGIVLVSQLIRDLAAQPRRHTIEIVAFAGEETGFGGSRGFLWRDEKAGIRAYVNIDTIGIRDLVADSRSDEDLLCLAGTLAADLGVDMNVVYLSEIEGDWMAFRAAGIPFINFHSLDRSALRLLHSRRDRLEIVDRDRLGDAYRLAFALIVNIDRGTVRMKR